jgi:nucleoside-triphosphatase THEP1
MVENRTVIQRLTILWAIAETTLGGILHAFKLPITGFVVGGFAVIVISFLAKYAKKEIWKTLLRATIMVLLAKFAMSPQSPPTAYLAVAFQGLAGAICFSIMPFRIAAPVFGFIALAESGLQRVLVLTLLFGTQLWQALQQYAQSIINWFGLHTEMSASGLVLTYAFIHAIWGLIIGIWCLSLPAKLEKFRYLLHPMVAVRPTVLPEKAQKARVGYFVLGLFLMSTFVFVSMQQGYFQAIYSVLLRGLAVVTLLFLVVRPLFFKLIRVWAQSQNTLQKAELSDFLNEVNSIQPKIAGIWSLAGRDYHGYRRLAAFVSGIMAWACLPVSNICILHGSIRSGKTTALQHWLDAHQDTIGFVTPDYAARRVLIAYPERQTYTFELAAEANDTVSVGKFYFSAQTFGLGRAILAKAMTSSQHWVVVDELGKLELNSEGFEPQLTQLINAIKQQPNRSMIIIVREELLQTVLNQYQLHDAWLTPYPNQNLNTCRNS